MGTCHERLRLPPWAMLELQAGLLLQPEPRPVHPGRSPDRPATRRGARARRLPASQARAPVPGLRHPGQQGAGSQGPGALPCPPRGLRARAGRAGGLGMTDPELAADLLAGRWSPREKALAGFLLLKFGPEEPHLTHRDWLDLAHQASQQMDEAEQEES